MTQARKHAALWGLWESGAWQAWAPAAVESRWKPPGGSRRRGECVGCGASLLGLNLSSLAYQPDSLGEATRLACDSVSSSVKWRCGTRRPCLRGILWVQVLVWDLDQDLVHCQHLPHTGITFAQLSQLT